jgi:hypothetical protein
MTAFEADDDPHSDWPVLQVQASGEFDDGGSLTRLAVGVIRVAPTLSVS